MIVRAAIQDDCAAMADILNQIIQIGGTTAFEDEKTPDDMREWYLLGADAICCHVAIDDGVVGFQSLSRYGNLPEGWGDIGTFVRADMQRGGAGAALFAATVLVARAAGLHTINATIRADNLPGLGYYARRSFYDYASDPDYRLKDGTRVGRVSKRYDL
jgi:L-amino acid N-acyltransferase YncA